MMCTRSLIIIHLSLLLATCPGFSQSSDTTISNRASTLEKKIKGTQKLDFLIGEWETESWFYGDGKRPKKPEKGSYKAAFTLNGAFVTDDIQAKHNGEDYMGKGFHSYNPGTQRYETWYFDSDGLVVLYPDGY